MPENNITLDKLVKRFDKLYAINGITVSFGPGVNTVLGPNGAGKSTLLKCIDGQYEPDSGTVLVNSRNPYLDDNLRVSMSLLTENYALYDQLTVADNLKFFGRLYGLEDSTTIERASGFLKELDAYQYINSRIYTLSRGTKQKIAFCRATINEPQIILLDEPTAFLDAHAAQLIRKILLRYAREGRIVVFVTQRIEEATMFGGRIVVIREGKLIKDTDTSSLYKAELKGMEVRIRLANPISNSIAKDIRGFMGFELENRTFLKVRVGDYRDIKECTDYLSSKGAYVISIDYAEPLIENLFFG